MLPSVNVGTARPAYLGVAVINAQETAEWSTTQHTTN